eukprot:TRINITY_DN779881_c0_g1_i1.p1 TRINITY_DN779881_c0_g1~~TRINITY_DN779881_c0_g1_i1.p1  ORF type:complete len:260 (+),score=64.62 TRINITY_DN779881_c0_g1_i1:27-806(+)
MNATLVGCNNLERHFGEKIQEEQELLRFECNRLQKVINSYEKTLSDLKKEIKHPPLPQFDGDSIQNDSRIDAILKIARTAITETDLHDNPKSVENAVQSSSSNYKCIQCPSHIARATATRDYFSLVDSHFEESFLDFVESLPSVEQDDTFSQEENVVLRRIAREFIVERNPFKEFVDSIRHDKSCDDYHYLIESRLLKLSLKKQELIEEQVKKVSDKVLNEFDISKASDGVVKEVVLFCRAIDSMFSKPPGRTMNIVFR